VLRQCQVTGLVDLRDARVGGTVDLDESHLTVGFPASIRTDELGIGSATALAAARMIVTGDLHARRVSTVGGQIWLWLASSKIGGNVDFDGAMLTNPRGPAINADRCTVDGSFTARHGFNTDAEVLLLHARVGSQLNFTQAMLGSARPWALHLGGAQVGSLWMTFAAPPVGRVRLSGLNADTIFDDPATWPTELDLIGCTYRLLAGRPPSVPGEITPSLPVSVNDRLSWLRRSPDGYAPQPYEQLADLYRRHGQDAEARRVLLEKQRRRRATQNLPARVFGYVLDSLIGYGYRTWLAGIWLLVFWTLGTLTFIAQPLMPRNPAEAPASSAALQSLDFLLPVVNLGQDNAWKSSGATQYVATLLILAGWVLTTSVIAGLTRLLNR